MLFEKGPVLVSRTGKSAVIHFDVLGQRIEKRRQQTRFIIAGRRFQLEPLLIFTGDHRLYPLRLIDRRLAQQVDRQVKSATPEEGKDTAATVRRGDDDCRHIGKIGTVQRHNATVGGQAGDQLAAGGNVHGFHKRKCPYRECKNLRQGKPCPTMCPGLTDSAPTAGHQ